MLEHAADSELTNDTPYLPIWSEVSGVYSE